LNFTASRVPSIYPAPSKRRTMSGYRILHRETVAGSSGSAIWSVATSSLLVSSSSSNNNNNNNNQQAKRMSGQQYRIWTASADGLVRSYRVKEKSMHDKQDDVTLDASALTLTCSHVLLGQSQSAEAPPPFATDDTAAAAAATTAAAPAVTALGSTQVCVGRNYCGEDNDAGDLIVASLDMAGIVRLWKIDEKEDESNNITTEADDVNAPKQLKAVHEFQVENATGTVLMLCPPRWTGPGRDVTVAVPCLDGTIAVVATGWLTPSKLADDSKPTEASPAGTVLDRWGSRGSAIVLSMTSHPTAPGVVAMGRQNGVLDTLVTKTHTTNSNNNNNSNNYQHQDEQKQRRHRLHLPGHTHDSVPIRSVSYTPDGNLLAAGNDAGDMAVWDVSRPSTPAVLAHHIVNAHKSWILDMVSLDDSRRWVTCGADRKLHVWKVDQMYQPVHTFDSEQTVWTMGLTSTFNSTNTNDAGIFDKKKTALRLATGTEAGGLQVLSLES